MSYLCYISFNSKCIVSVLYFDVLQLLDRTNYDSCVIVTLLSVS